MRRLRIADCGLRKEEESAAGAAAEKEAGKQTGAGGAELLSAIRNPQSAILSLWPWLAAAATGLLLTFCFPRWNQTWLCWIALTPLICAVWFSPRPARRAWARNASLGYVAGIVF